MLLEILRLHLGGEKLSEDVDLTKIARKTKDYSGSDLKSKPLSSRNYALCSIWYFCVKISVYPLQWHPSRTQSATSPGLQRLLSLRLTMLSWCIRFKTDRSRFLTLCMRSMRSPRRLQSAVTPNFANGTINLETIRLELWWILREAVFTRAAVVHSEAQVGLEHLETCIFLVERTNLCRFKLPICRLYSILQSAESEPWIWWGDDIPY